MDCPVCHGVPRPLFAKDQYDILQCSACGHRMTVVDNPENHISRIYGDDYFTGGGAGYQDYLAEGALLRSAGRRYGKLLSRYASPGRILDVGSAAGFILKGLQDCGWDGVGIEPNAAMARHATEVLGLHMMIGGLEDVDLAESYDAVSLIQVIGHFQDPRHAVGLAARSLKSGGLMLIETWDRKSLTARLFGRHWHEYSPPSVLHWFSRDGLRQMGTGCGLTHVGHGRPLKMLNGGHAKSLLKHKLETWPLGAVASRLVNLLPDHLPLLYPFDDIFWMLFRKP